MRSLSVLTFLTIIGLGCEVGFSQDDEKPKPEPVETEVKGEKKNNDGPDPESLKAFEAKVQKQIAERIVKEAKEDVGLAPAGPPQVMVIVEMIEVEHDDFSEWIQENPLRTEASDLRQAVQTWVKAKRAKIRETMVVSSRSGQRAKAEGIDEIIYPTEYNPGQMPGTVTLNGEAEAPTTPPTPTAFETRNAGITLEVDPVLGQNGEIDLNLAPELVFHVEDKVIGTNIGDDVQEVTMPVFHTVKMTTQVTLLSGGYAFLGTSRLHGKQESEMIEDSLVLVFVRADAL